MRRRGFALVTVLWIALVMGLLVAAMAEVSGRAGRAAGLAQQRLAADALVDLGLNRAIWMLKTQGAPDLRPDGLVWRQDVGDSQIALRVVAADALVDLNTASPAVLTDLAAAFAKRLNAADAQDDLATGLLALKGQALGPLDVTGLATGLVADRSTAYGLAGLVTVGSGRTAPDVTIAPAAVLQDVLGLDPEATAALLDTRRNSGPGPVPAPDHYADPQYDSEAQPRGTIWHIAVAAGKPGATVRAGQVWVVYLPLTETRPTRPFQQLARWPLPVDDPVFVALDEP